MSSDPEELDDDLDLEVLEKVKQTDKKSVAGQIPTHHKLDESQLDTYIYPTNLPIRDYQYSIVNRALFHNVLVALPTGLGKTFIASTVMYNYLRWFPELKIIFMAPTKPLVAQQIKACCSITGIPSSKAAILLDRTRKNRAEIWAEKSVFFTTPQVVENDLTAGIVHPKLIVLLVVDEAHRAKGNYAYNNVVKFISRFSKSFRILALTATPASKADAVQEIVDNLKISYVEVRTERSIDIFKYLKRKKVERINVGLTDDVYIAIEAICEAITPVLRIANQKRIFDISDPHKINSLMAIEAQQRIKRDPGIPEALKWTSFFLLQVLSVAGQCLRRLHIYGLRTFYEYFLEKYIEFTTKYNNGKSTNHNAAKFYCNDSLKKLMANCKTTVADPNFLGHEKMSITISELNKFFKESLNPDSRVIIFTELRLSALDLVRAIERKNPETLKPHIFIGQAKEKEKFDEEIFLNKGKKKKAGDPAPKKKKADKGTQTSSELAQVSGMNQKMQKEIIKKFKAGEYNILVATSIGEEGLDIGEVDLIICYDSTSSPIKNVQRMGRTGRNRDGKVIMLFSSNEETKFNSAMEHYEYIQQHIMKGLVQMNEQNRILPAHFAPRVEEKKIEIPRENSEIEQVDDEDEIIRLATKYMTQSNTGTKTGGTSKTKTATSTKLKQNSTRASAKSDKTQKRFFMPDDVEAGFRLAGQVLRGDDPETAKKRRIEEHGSDFLDSLLDSDDDILLAKKPATDTILLSLDSQHAKSEEIHLEKPSPKAPPFEKPPPKAPPQKFALRAPGKLLGPLKPKVLRQQEIFNWRNPSGVLESPKATTLSHKSFQEDKQMPSPDNIAATMPSMLATDPKDDLPAKVEVSEDDDFSDDEDILALAKKTHLHWEREASLGVEVPKTLAPANALEPTSGPKQKSKAPQMIEKSQDPMKEEIFKVDTNAGLLTDDQKQELYLHYYATPEHNEKLDYSSIMYTPQDGYEVSHSKNSLRYISFCLLLRKLENDVAEDALELYDTLATKPQPPFADMFGSQ